MSWMHAFFTLAYANLGLVLVRLYDRYVLPKIEPWRKP